MELSREASQSLVELPEAGRLYKSADGLFCRIIDLVTFDKDESCLIVYRPIDRHRSRAMPLTMFMERVLWPDGHYRQRFMPAPHLPRGQREVAR